MKKKKKKKKKEKKNAVLWVDGPVFLFCFVFVFVFIFVFNFLVAKMTLKKGKFRNQSDFFCRKILGKYFDLFSKIFSKIFRFWLKNG